MWDLEDCAVCRTKDAIGNISDQVLGCVQFKFSRDSDGNGSIAPSVLMRASAPPGQLWRKALRNWANLTGDSIP